MNISLKNKTICLIIPSLRHGGAERVISILANEWSKNSDTKVNILLLTKQDKFYDISKKVNIIEPNKLYSKNVISKLFYTLWVLLFIRKKINSLKPDSILSFCECYNNLVLLSLWKTDNKIFVSDRNNPNNFIGVFHEFLRKKLYKNATGIIAQTETAKKILIKKTNNRNIKVIPNPLREIIHHKEEISKNIILNVGRFEIQKNQKELIEIFSLLKNKENWKLILLGEGSLKSELVSLVEKLQLQNHVEILDFQYDIDAYFQQAKIFAFTSIYEGFPNALSEAMANGLASIAYDCPTGPSELIENNINGLLIPLYNKEEYVKNLDRLIIDNAFRDKIGIEALKVNDKLSVSKIALDYLRFISK
ncbi:glycosyltransferase [Flavobacterium sp.]|uniref:glycosyltransferase n=1 Tax=Flavobacterium sp. TaxID=239 RepID=UPI00261867F0|nr:glycosyltransferase [Flavobacterium sp.]MDD3003617.1 glycosyltransferase [Flavobacterium sp.]